MECRRDFIAWLGTDMATNVLMYIDDPGDLVRASAVSRSWHRFVVANGFCKKLYSRFHPEASNFMHLIEVKSTFEPAEGNRNSTEWENLERDHRMYALFIRLLDSPVSIKTCIHKSIAASSTDNYPEESIWNTLNPSDRVNGRPSYWSSIGEDDPKVPETLTYRLRSSLCVIEQINIQPFEAYFQVGYPIYSAQAVRFRLGCPALLQEVETSTKKEPDMVQQSASCDYVWSYVSPTYPMTQANTLQSFKLPRPVLCIGGILQVELLGRVQKQEMDGLYYICVCHVQAVGRALSPIFDVDILDPRGKFVLKYFPEAKDYMVSNYLGRGFSHQPEHDNGGSGLHSTTQRVRDMRARICWDEMILTLFGAGPDDDDSDE